MATSGMHREITQCKAVQNMQKNNALLPHAGVPWSLSQIWCKFVCPWLSFTDPTVVTV